MKKNIFCLIFNLLCLYKSFCEVNSLQKLWECVLDNNFDLLMSEDDLNEVNLKIKNSWKKYLPDVSIRTSADFSTGDSDYERVPDDIVAAINLNEQLPGGRMLSVGPTVSLSKGIANYEKSISIDNMKFTDSMNLSISYYRYLAGINPAYVFKDIELEKLLLSGKLQEMSKEVKIQEILEGVTEVFISLRKILREIELVKLNINFYSEWVKAYKSTGTIDKGVSEKDVFFVENEKYKNEENLKNLEQNFLNLYIKLQNFINFDDIFEIFDENFSFFCDLNVIKNIITFDNSKIKCLEFERKINKLDSIEGKQKEAPLLLINASLPVYDNAKKASFEGLFSGNSKRWEVSISVDFANLFNGKLNETERKFELNDRKLEKQYEKTQKNLKNEINFYKNLLKTQQNKLEIFEKNLKNNMEIYEGLKNSFEKNQCSYIDFRKSELAMESSKEQLENLQDDIWYYGWMLSIRDMN